MEAEIAGAPTRSKTFTYGDNTWKDLLTEYEGQKITYDGVGNPLSYRDGMTMSWECRQLKTVKTSGLSMSFQYDANGQRKQKVANGTKTSYWRDTDGKLVRMETGTDVALFQYEGDGRRLGMQLNGEGYYYVYNSQGDVVGLVDKNGQSVVQYGYDAWGHPTSVTGSAASTVGALNPFRYRGYEYDVETGFYYLTSRYYDPEIGRFLNADSVTDGGAGILGYNLFIYAANNPINNSDSSGHWIIKDAIKWVAKNIAKPVVKTAQKTLSKVNATYSRGIAISGTPSAFSFNLQGGISVDTKGNIALQGSFSGGINGGSPAISATVYQTTTNAPSIDKLGGSGYQFGGAIGAPVYGIPLVAGGDFNIIPDTNQNKTYFGLTTNAGLGTPGGEFHVEWGETATMKSVQFNVFDIAERIYIKIMEW